MKKKDLQLDLFRAYYDTRKNKRSTINALKFEVNYEQNLFQLCDDLYYHKYKIGQSICFISFHPVKREIFAANFRDRVVHHLIYNYISGIFERYFINDCYSCRIGKGTSFGIKRMDHFIRSCSQNYHSDCYILKLDILGYFMSIDRLVLYQQIEQKLKNNKKEYDFDLEFVLSLIKKNIFHDATQHCCIKGQKIDWEGLPRSKSLFYVGKNKGLPIGNITSQLFGNIYLNDFDHFVKTKLKIKYYGRYVDDFVLIDKDKKHLLSIIPILNKYLKENLFLSIHPKKIYLQHFSKGMLFLGKIIKPNRIYIGKRTKDRFFKAIQYWNSFIRKNKVINSKNLKLFLSSMNSYLGMMKHHQTYRLRKKMLTKNLSAYFWNYVYVSKNYSKLELKIKNI